MGLSTHHAALFGDGTLRPVAGSIIGSSFGDGTLRPVAGSMVSRAAWQDGPIHPPRRPVRGARCLMCGVAGWTYPPATPLSYVRVSVDKTYDTLAFYTVEDRVFLFSTTDEVFL